MGSLSISWSATDWLGSERLRTDGTGKRVGLYTSLPFGEGLVRLDGTDSDAVHFTGKERDADPTDVGAGGSGLDYFGARYYSSNMGRFLSPDWSDRPEAVPYADLTNPQSLNLYGYVGNNPLSRVDTDGHDGFKDFLNGLANATYRPAITAIQHPFVTGQALGNAFIHPIATAEAFRSSVVTTRAC